MVKGQIILWYGAVVDIPGGWALCDGDNGTPLLVDRFILGAGNAYAPGATGGSVTHAHTFHDPGHRHTIVAGDDIAAGSDWDKITQWGAADGSTTPTSTFPIYHALCFIMKLYDDPDPVSFAAFPYAAKAIVQFIMDGPDLLIYLTFKHKMNTDNKPANGLWLCELDGVPDPVDTSAWLDHWTMLLTILAPGGAPTMVTVEYDGPDENLATVWDKQWEPWGPIQGSDFS